MQDVLKIKMLGEFSINYNNRSVGYGSRTNKPWMLLEYLVAFRKRGVSQSELIDLLWPDDEEDVDNPINTLKTILYRIRTQLEELGFADGKKIITYSRSMYYFNPDVPIEVDSDIFEELCKKGSAPNFEENEKINILSDAIDLYKGDYLPKSAHIPWVIPLNTYYHSLYVKAVLEICGMLAEQKRWDEILEICQHAITIDAYIEQFHQYLIRSLIATGQQRAAATHYDYVTNFFYTQLGVNPSEELSSLYKQIKQTVNSAEIDLNAIKKSLDEQQMINGAFFCEYEFFKDLYRIESRVLERNGMTVYITLMTVTGRDGDDPPQKTINSSMNALSKAIESSLRRGDIYTRYSVCQYLIILSTVSFESGNKVVERVVSEFKKRYKKPTVNVNYKLLPVDPSSTIAS